MGVTKLGDLNRVSITAILAKTLFFVTIAKFTRMLSSRCASRWRVSAYTECLANVDFPANSFKFQKLYCSFLAFLCDLPRKHQGGVVDLIALSQVAWLPQNSGMNVTPHTFLRGHRSMTRFIFCAFLSSEALQRLIRSAFA